MKKPEPINPQLSEDFITWRKTFYAKVLCGQMRIEQGEPKNQVAADLGLLPFEFDSILERALNE